MKHCTPCDKDKPLTDFYKGSNGVIRGICKECHNESVTRWQKTKGKDSRLRSKKKYAGSTKRKASGKRHRATVQGRYRTMEKSSLSKGFPTDITKEQYSILVAAPCTYCGGPLPVSGIGLDRIDDLKGYTQNNVLPCCGECNRIRSDVYTVEEMRTIIGPAIRKLRELRNPLVAHGERAAL